MQKPNAKSNRSKNPKNPLETLSDVGNGMLDQFFGYNEAGEDLEFAPQTQESKKKSGKQEFKVFNYTEYSETTLIKRKINELTDLIRKEIEFLKKENSALASEVKDVEKLTINELPEKPGIYHVRFLELVLNVIKHLRAKVGESKTWLEALVSKKKKRGSLFAARSKKQGTQYSLSQELTSARSVQ